MFGCMVGHEMLVSAKEGQTLFIGGGQHTTNRPDHSLKLLKDSAEHQLFSISQEIIIIEDECQRMDN